MRIQDLMTTAVRTCEPSDTLARAAEIMWEADCGCAVVVDGENRVVGLLTDRDVAMAAYLQGKRLDEISVSGVMSRHIATCSPLDTPASAELTMQERQIRRLPVIDGDGRLLGVVSLADLAYQMAHMQTFGGDGMSWVSIGRTLSAVCEPRRMQRYLA